MTKRVIHPDGHQAAGPDARRVDLEAAELLRANRTAVGLTLQEAVGRRQADIPCCCCDAGAPMT